MAQDSATTDSRAQTAAERLKAIRARVAELHRRIKTERDPKAVAELRAEVGKLGEIISELIAAAGTGAQVEKADSDAAAWPADMNLQPRANSEWGPDPAEVAGG